MPIRGKRPIMPKAGGTPTGMFSSKRRQKQDGASGPNMDTLKYAHGTGTRVGQLTSQGGQGKRHQKNFGINDAGHSSRSIPTEKVQMPKYSNPKQTGPGASPQNSSIKGRFSKAKSLHSYALGKSK